MDCKSLNNIYTKEQQQQQEDQQHNNNNNNYMMPRISFSNGFAEAKISNDHSPAVASATAAFDFEFSVPTFDMNSADKLFFNGKLLPVVEDQGNLGGVKQCFSAEFGRKKLCTTTLRDELLLDHDDDDDDNGDSNCYGSENEAGLRTRLPRLHKGGNGLSCKWKQKFGSFRY
ncbi:hypothetical protein RND81_13G161100 [Saponaria officinalis]|uniref:Uncharacterized protein n=1 Tax=Saponaria officinalis TaxID=3572 RepID=A0AAW1H5Y5_SAPOF